MEEVVKARGIAQCLDMLELIVKRQYYSELSLGLPAGDNRLVLLGPGKLAEQEGLNVVEVGDYSVKYMADNADSRRAIRRFARVIAIEPEPPFVVLVRIYKEPGLLMAKFDVVLRDCVKDKPRVLAFEIGHALELKAELEIGDRTYTLRRP